MDLELLQKGINNKHPCLQHAPRSVTKAAEHLRKLHRKLMSDKGGLSGYLYQLQVAKVKQLRRELDECQKQTTNK